MVEKLMLAMVMQKFACCRKALVVVPRLAFDFRAATNVKIAADWHRYRYFQQFTADLQLTSDGMKNMKLIP
uniref:Uncharacterized protein n=1 Tax=Romanomermis culicivorax TaxID=13658 RepID=A0A915LA21_ROMCU